MSAESLTLSLSPVSLTAPESLWLGLDRTTTPGPCPLLIFLGRQKQGKSPGGSQGTAEPHSNFDEMSHTARAPEGTLLTSSRGFFLFSPLCRSPAGLRGRAAGPCARWGGAHSSGRLSDSRWAQGASATTQTGITSLKSPRQTPARFTACSILTWA